ncbi:SAF domain-containing protein [Tessaracoccus flavus]|nr:SAF domain-containing protein [Tessaracoccus flavus]
MLIAASVVTIAQWVARPAPETRAVVTLAVDLTAGQLISAEHVEMRQIPDSALPLGAFSSDDGVVGRAVAVGLSRGTVLQDGLLASGQEVSAGRAAVPITLPDARLLTLLRPGDAVTLVAVGMDSADVITDLARIAALPTESQPGVLSVGSGGAGGLVLVDVPVDQAPRVAAMGQTGQLSVILGGG